MEVINAGGVGSGYEIAGVVAEDAKIYALGKEAGASEGVISSASLYYVRQICTGDSDVAVGESGSASMAFPVMSSMTEVNDEAAIGISSGHAYKLAYDGSSPVSVEVNFPGATSINAFCIAGS